MKLYAAIFAALVAGFACTFYAAFSLHELNTSTEPVRGLQYLLHVALPLLGSFWLAVGRSVIRAKTGAGTRATSTVISNTTASVIQSPAPSGSAAERFKAAIDMEADRQRAEIAAHVQHAKETIGGAAK